MAGQHLDLLDDVLDGTEGYEWFFPCLPLVLDLPCEGERARHAIDAMERTIAAGEYGRVGMFLQLRVGEGIFLDEMASRERKFVQISQQLPGRLVGRLPLHQSCDTFDDGEITPLLNGFYRFGCCQFRFTADDDDTFVYEKFVCVIRHAGPHGDDPGVGMGLADVLDAFQVRF